MMDYRLNDASNKTPELASQPLPRLLRCAPWILVLVVGCGKSEPAETGDDARATEQAAPAIEPKTEATREHPIVQINTSRGPIQVRLDAARAPGTVRNFLNYANEGFYDNTLIHYVDPGNMIMAGGYSADGKAKEPGPPIRNEAHNGLLNTRGTIAMARAQTLIDSATSQFFINLRDAPQRDHHGSSADEYGYCVFGQVVEGLEIADEIAQASTRNLGGDLLQTPDPAVVISSIRLVQ